MIRQLGTDAYGFLRQQLALKGTENVGELDVAPASPVHDLSRIAELGSGVGVGQGWFLNGVATSAAIAGTTRGSLTLDDLFNPAFGPIIPIPRVEAALWLMQVSVVSTFATIANVASVTVGVSRPPPFASLSSDDDAVVVADYTLVGNDELVAGEGVPIFPAHTGVNLPAFLPPGSVIRIMLAAVGVVTAARANTLIWCGRKGSRPPGIA